MAIKKTAEDGICTIEVDGVIDASYLLDFQDELVDCSRLYTKIFLDMSKVEYISSAGLRIILSTHKTMAAKDGLIIVNPSEGVKQIFDITGFTNVLNVQ